MADISSHIPGTFSWVELATIDQKAGVTFYKTLFGWDVKEQPIGPTEVYSMFTMRGQEVGAACTMQPDERKMGVPPHWNLYVTVADVDETAKRAESLGAKVLAAAVRRDGCGPDGCPAGSHRRRVPAVAGGEEHRREDPQRARRALLERAHDARHEGGRIVLHRALRLDAEAQRAGARSWNTRSSASRASRASA